MLSSTLASATRRVGSDIRVDCGILPNKTQMGSFLRFGRCLGACDAPGVQRSHDLKKSFERRWLYDAIFRPESQDSSSLSAERRRGKNNSLRAGKSIIAPHFSENITTALLR